MDKLDLPHRSIERKVCDYLRSLGFTDASTQEAIDICMSKCPYDRCYLFQPEPRTDDTGVAEV